MKIFKLILFCAIAISGSCQSKLEDDIILINTGSYDKGRIAREIAIIDSLKPKVISVDVAFLNYTGNQEDKLLYRVLQDTKKLVMPSTIHYGGKDYYDREMISIVLASAMEFFPRHATTGFVSAKVEGGQTQIPKQFIVWQEGYTGDIYYHFSVVTAMAFDSLRASNFIQSHERLVDVDYKNGKRAFKTFSASDVLKRKLTKEDIEGKIVMMGFLGPGNTDKFISPLNNQNKPDMYGLEYLANIVAQILEHSKERMRIE